MPDFATLTKKKKIDSKATSPTIMFPFRDTILYAKKMGKEVIGFHTKSYKFKRRHRSDVLSIAAMCGDDHHVFLFNYSTPEFITVMDSNLQPEGKIDTHLSDTDVKGCNFEMCLGECKQFRTTDNFPELFFSYGSVRAFSQKQGILWQLDCRSDPRLDLTFNPCSISSSKEGDVFIADQSKHAVRSIRILFNCLENQLLVF